LDRPYGKVLEEKWDRQWDGLDEHLQFDLECVSESMRILRDDGLCFVFGQVGKREHGFLHLSSLLCRHFEFHDRFIWDRVVGYHERRDSLTPAYEEILVLRKSAAAVKFHKAAVREPYDPETIRLYSRDKRYQNRKARLEHLLQGKFARNIISVPSLRGSSHEKVGHPCQKPIALILILLLLTTDPGDLVLDPFLGSGTTAVSNESRRLL
jgi:site-specific DNA-methyltransferase (adenine-specific)